MHKFPRRNQVRIFILSEPTCAKFVAILGKLARIRIARKPYLTILRWHILCKFVENKCTKVVKLQKSNRLSISQVLNRFDLICYQEYECKKTQIYIYNYWMIYCKHFTHVHINKVPLYRALYKMTVSKIRFLLKTLPYDNISQCVNFCQLLSKFIEILTNYCIGTFKRDFILIITCLVQNIFKPFISEFWPSFHTKCDWCIIKVRQNIAWWNDISASFKNCFYKETIFKTSGCWHNLIIYVINLSILAITRL